MGQIKFAYITNNRLPSEKANAFQIAQMCAALAAQGAELTLFYPARHNAQFAKQDLFDYYGLPRKRIGNSSQQAPANHKR